MNAKPRFYADRRTESRRSRAAGVRRVVHVPIIRDLHSPAKELSFETPSQRDAAMAWLNEVYDLAQGRLAVIEKLSEQLAAMQEKVSATIYKVGNPDPTPDGGDPCHAESEEGFVCTWNEGHAHPQHVAGDGKVVVGVWPA